MTYFSRQLFTCTFPLISLTRSILTALESLGAKERTVGIIYSQGSLPASQKTFGL